MNKKLLDSFLNYEAVSKQGKDIRPGDLFLIYDEWHCVSSVKISIFMDHGPLEIFVDLKFVKIQSVFSLDGQKIFVIKTIKQPYLCLG